ncbi:hypothetical protein [Sabulibacter ruber]|uniref:hypothetical protein n=1 Tax=Sabulibacter ruber TaxID=2811901 RepID=UPI001A96EA1A|nr:hypothetical protein [Sabulibacter ruber]
MLLYKDGLLELNYEVTTDILSVRWPDLKFFSIAEIQYSLNKLVDALKHYDIKKLLIDSTSSTVEISEEEQKTIAYKFALMLQGTRVQKVARIINPDIKREQRSQKISGELTKEMTFTIQFENFPDQASALSWLSAK